jgi:decaprenylphospho-beta-D-erythro-pentofuranosid-2-ulose 2-reductase
MNDATGMPQSAVVIGGTSELAREVLRVLLARRLRRIVLVGRDPAGLADAAADLRMLGAEQVETVICDVNDVERHAALAAEVAERLDGIDLVIVAAGSLGDAERDGRDPVATAEIFTTNCTGPSAIMVAFANVLRLQGHGRIVVFSSVAGVRVRRANFVYGAAKAGVDAFAQGLGDALHGTGVAVTVVRPGFVHTKMTAGLDVPPFATTAEAVAAAVVRGIEKGATVVWVPSLLRWVFAIFRLLPRTLWRRMPG